jgi:hypothetical protein
VGQDVARKILYDKRLVVGLDVGQSSAIVDTILFDFEQQNITTLEFTS